MSPFCTRLSSLLAEMLEEVALISATLPLQTMDAALQVPVMAIPPVRLTPVVVT